MLMQMDPSSFHKLKSHVRSLLTRKTEPLLKLRTIDTVQRLGVAYHFEDEISEVLNSISMDSPLMNDVYYSALFFRLHRQNHSSVFPGNYITFCRSLYDIIGTNLLKTFSIHSGNISHSLKKAQTAHIVTKNRG